MGIQALQKFIETNCPGACVPVDLLKIARSVAVRRSRGNKGFTNARLCLVVDGECCLDRLYGGFFSDWVCGGQWNRMVQFLAVLIQTIQHNNIELAVFFNGSLESQRMGEWIKQQHNERKKINQVLKHVNTKGTPPPKVWWVPPVCLTTCLRMALRHLNIAVVCTMDDHHQEVIAYCRENYFHGLMAEDAEYAIFDPPRYFSSEQLKLTYKGSLETKEFILDEVAKGLDLHPNRFCVFAALLGNYLLTEEDLHEFYKTICPEAKTKQLIPSDVLIRAVCTYVRALPTIDNLDVIGSQVFGANVGPNDERIQKFKQCVQYYLNGTKDGFLRYRPSNNARRYEPGHYPPSRPFPSRSGQAPAAGASVAPASNPSPAASTGATTTSSVATSVSSPTAQDGQTNSTSPSDIPPTSDPSKFASETVESELSSLSAYQEATGMYASQIPAPQIVIDPPTQSQIMGTDSSNSVTKVSNNKISPNTYENEEEAFEERATAGLPVVSAGSYGAWVNGASALSSTPMQPTSKTGTTVTAATLNRQAQLPNVPPEVMRTASERHQKGLMSPWIYQILSQGEIKIALSIEEETPKDLPSAALLYRPIRQMVYAILFNMHHVHFLAKQKADQIKQAETVTTGGLVDSPTDISVKEWVWVKNNPYKSPEDVKAVPLGWAVPTVQRLWFGAAVDDKKRRLRAFLTCMRSDSALMLNTSYVPQHLLVMCCVLRYIISFNDKRILRKQELDAFLAQAVSPQLMNAPCMQNMQLPLITCRGVQLAALFMRGVEAALFANDACGAPVPWLMCCPWLFFDGKLFHHKLLKANTAKNLIEICDGQIDQVAKVERMRQAILEGLKVEFARPPLPMMAPPRVPGFAPPPPHMLPAGAHFPGGRGRARGILAAGEPGRAVAGRRGMLARGGQLEIAGVVVGSWGPNFGAAGRGRSLQVAPQVTSVGGMRRYGAVPGGMSFPRGGYTAYGLRRVPARIKKMGPQITGPRKKPRKPSVVRPTRTTVGEEDTNEPVIALGRGCTLQAGDSKVVPVSQLMRGGAGDSITEKVTLNGQFEDAREESAKTVIMKKGQGDPPVVVSNNVAANPKEAKKEVIAAAAIITQSGDGKSTISEAMSLASEVD